MQTKSTADETRRSSARLAIAEAVDVATEAAKPAAERDPLGAMHAAVARLDREVSR